MQKQEHKRLFLCRECGKPIEGDHVYIKTRRGSELHIHYQCISKGSEKGRG